MEQLAWQKQVNFEVENDLVNNNYRLGQAVRLIVKKDIGSLEQAIKVIHEHIEDKTTLKK